MEAAGSTQVPFDLIQSSLCEYLDRDTLSIVDCDIKRIETTGLSGNDFYRAVVSLQEGQRTRLISLIVKRWRPTAWTALATGTKVSREALAWENGLITAHALPKGLRAPFIGAGRDKGGAWIVMEDISSEFAAFDSPTEKHENARLLLDRLARFHVCWERTDRLAQLQGHRWLFSQEARLHWVVDCYLKWLGEEHTGAVDRENLRRFKMSCPDGLGEIRPNVLAFLESVPRQDRDLWKQHMLHREALAAAFSQHSQVLLHGDMNERNNGIRRINGDDEVYLVDWEWVGMGAPAIDVVSFVWHFALFGHNDRQATDVAAALQDYYFCRYIAHGGQKTDHKGWRQSCDLAHVFYDLALLPTRGGGALRHAKKREEVEWVTRETERATDTMRKVFN